MTGHRQHDPSLATRRGDGPPPSTNRTSRRHFLLGLGASAAALGLGACGGATTATAPPAAVATAPATAATRSTASIPGTAARATPSMSGTAALGAAPKLTGNDGSFKRVQDAKKLVFGSSNDQPYAFLNPTSNQIEGIDADMLQYLITALGIPQREMVQSEFSALIPGVMSKRFDVIADAMYITDKRKQQINFTDPWYQYGESLVVAKGNPAKINTWADFKGKKAASYLGTVYQDWLDAEKANGVQVSSYPDVPTGLQDLAAGRIDVIVVDAPVAAWDLKQFPDLGAKLEIVAGYQPREIGHIGAGVRKEDVDLRDAFNWALKKMKTEGQDLVILKKWGLTEENRDPTSSLG